MAFENISAITIYEVEELKELFLKALDSDDFTHFDMSKVQRIDLVGMQLLIALLKSAQKREKKIKFINISSSLHEQMQETLCIDSLGEAL
ncbi:STAS domain-containing protein [Sulfurimonas sp. SAG-AH-194-C21]|nr:STAS domain-containing protein [Sulfurimonas sp. SAG-AH-194-C21]MDF1884061.1 STAS domain-containing protein [Sulfurimonas sp. SAG-AH-194-C21]